MRRIFGITPVLYSTRQVETELTADAPLTENATHTGEHSQEHISLDATAVYAENVSDADIVDMARNARNGNKFADLFFRGDTSRYQGNHSAADIALCNILAFWTRDDAGRMDRLFRRSCLMRPKWDEKHSSDGRTYSIATLSVTLARHLLRQLPQCPFCGSRSG